MGMTTESVQSREARRVLAFRSVLAGLVLVLAVLGVALRSAPPATAESAESPVSAMFSPIPPTVTITAQCPPGPISVWPAAATPTSLTFRYEAVCPNNPIAVVLYENPQRTRQQSLDITPYGASSGTLTFSRLQPAFDYYWSYADADTYWNGPGPFGPVRTLAEGAEPTEFPQPTGSWQPTASFGPTRSAEPSQPPRQACRATISILSRWEGGFLASVKVTNAGDAPLAWNVSWAWPGAETINSVSNAVLTGTAGQPRLTGVAWNRSLAPGASAEAFLTGTGDPGFRIPTPICSS